MQILLTIAGGVALILFGVRLLRKGLDRLFGLRLATWMQRLARSRIRAFLTGLGVAIVAPSSTSISVLAVQTVQAGQLSARRMLAIMLGADVGLTITVQLIALRLEQYAPAVILVGVVLHQFTRGWRSRGIGQVILSLGFIFLGVLTIKGATGGIDPTGDFAQLVEIASGYPWLLAILAAVMAMLLQSATATIALVIGLGAGGAIDVPLSLAVPWVVGANVGVVLTTLLIGWSRIESRRLAVGNLLAKGVTGVLVLILLEPVTQLIALMPAALANQVANTHTGFNLVLGLAGLPLVVSISRLVEWMVPEPTGEAARPFGPRYIDTAGPVDSTALALGQSRREILRISEIVRSMLEEMWVGLRDADEQRIRDVSERDDQVDLLDEQTKRFLTRVVSQEYDPEAAAEQMLQLRYLAELETIGDIIDKNLCELALKRIAQHSEFSREGWEDLQEFFSKVREAVRIAETAFATRDEQLARQLLRHKQRVDAMERELRDRHFNRLKRGLAESHETSAIHLDLLTHLKRVNSCVTHVAYAIVQPAAAGRAVPEG